MKRTPLARSSLSRAKAPLKPSKPLNRGSGRLGRKWREKPVLSGETREAVIAAHELKGRGLGFRCACRCGRVVDPRNPACWHHIYAKHKFPELFDMPANLVLLAVDCHSSHETAIRRLSRSVIASAEVLATTPQRESYLERTYGPPEPDEKAAA